LGLQIGRIIYCIIIVLNIFIFICTCIKSICEAIVKTKTNINLINL